MTNPSSQPNRSSADDNRDTHLYFGPARHPSAPLGGGLTSAGLAAAWACGVASCQRGTISFPSPLDAHTADPPLPPTLPSPLRPHRPPRSYGFFAQLSELLQGDVAPILPQLLPRVLQVCAEMDRDRRRLPRMAIPAASCWPSPAAALPPSPPSAPPPSRVDPGIAHGLANDDPS